LKIDRQSVIRALTIVQQNFKVMSLPFLFIVYLLKLTVINTKLQK